MESLINMEYHITYEEIKARISKWPKEYKYYGVPRGGAYISSMMPNTVMTPEEADVIVDDLIDSGATRDKYRELYPLKAFLAPFDKQQEAFLKGKWLVFPWEVKDEIAVEENVVRILQYLGQDTNREGLKETPKRFIKYLKEITTPQEFNFTTFQNEGIDEMIIQTDIPFYSMCEHHLAPFFGTANVAYIPNDKIVGLSKLARTVDTYAKALQNQERITSQIAYRLENELKPKGVAVSLKAKHLCMCSRGVYKEAFTITNKLIGAFKEQSEVRNEFLSFIKR